MRFGLVFPPHHQYRKECGVKRGREKIPKKRSLPVNTDIRGKKSKQCFQKNAEEATAEDKKDVPGEQYLRSIAVFYPLMFFSFAKSADSSL